MKQRAIALFCFLLLLLMVGTVSAGTYVIKPIHDAQIYATGTGDGKPWLTLRNEAGYGGTDNTTYPYLVRTDATAVANNYSQLNRYGIGFNLTQGGVPATDIIDTAILRMKWASKATTLGGTSKVALVAGSPTNYLDYVDADYSKYGTTELATRLTFPTSGNINLTLNAAGITYINTKFSTGLSVVLYLMDADEFDGTFTGTWGSGYARELQIYGGTYSDSPYIEVTTHAGAAPDTTPPASITSLTNITTCQNITWQWTNPTDIDFDVVQIYQDNTFLHNVTGNTDFWDPLSESTAYTFSSHTCDTTGNCNTTWVNLTSTTDTCPVPTTSPTTTATTAPPTPTPTPTPLAGCTYFNLTGVTFGINSTDWNVTEGLNTWGVSTFNATQGNVSWWICRATPAPTILPTWQPLINPSTDIKIDWLGLLWSWWWLPVLIFIMILLFRRK